MSESPATSALAAAAHSGQPKTSSFERQLKLLQATKSRRSYAIPRKITQDENSTQLKRADLNGRNRLFSSDVIEFQ
jgi:hypothetical protein